MSDLVSRQAILEKLINMDKQKEDGYVLIQAYFDRLLKRLTDEVKELPKGAEPFQWAEPFQGAEPARIIDAEIETKYFRAVKKGIKNFALISDDDGITPGDILHLHELDGCCCTGLTVKRAAKYVLRDCPEDGLMDGYCIVGW